VRLSCALLFALAACGDGGTAPDAAATPDADLSMVRVHVLVDEGDNARGHRVFFQDADSELVLATLTDGDGRANAFMAAGGSVTVVRRGVEVLGTDLFTHMNVSTDDEVVVDLRGRPQRLRTIYVRVREDEGAQQYELFSSCGSAPVTGADLEPQAADLRDCGDVADLLVRSDRGRFQYRAAAPIPPNIRITFDSAWEAPVWTSVELQHVPFTHPSVLVSQRLTGQTRSFYPQDAGAVVFLQPAEGAVTGTFNQPIPMPAGSTLLTRVTPFQQTTPGGLSIVDWGPPKTTTAIDVAPLALRAYLTMPDYDASTHRVSWLEGDHGVLADGVLARVLWSDARGGVAFSWNVLAPRGESAAIELPVLPDPDLRPFPDASVQELLNIKLDGGFARLRTMPLLGEWRPSSERPWLLDAPSGRVVYQSLGVVL
jgi:hypothetical protein